MEKLKDIWYNHKKAIIIIICVILGILAFRTVNIYLQNSNSKGGDSPLLTDEELEDLEKDDFNGTNTYIWEKQEKLTKKFGKSDEGFIWNDDGTQLALGDKSMSGEDVVYVYLQSLSKLDLANAQKYSRKTDVVKRYMSFYDEKRSTDFAEQFNRNMYAEVLKSIQIKKVESTASLESNKQVYTVQASIIDLTNKDFWKNDRNEIYNALSKYKLDQGDTTKADTYLYDYILGYYRKPTAIRTNISFDITVEKFADLDTGWLVSTDTDLDNACIYKDGKGVLTYIKEEYKRYRVAERTK